jgi:hypothetical protein
VISVNTICAFTSYSLNQLNPSPHLLPHRHALTHLSKMFSATSNSLRMKKKDSVNSVKENSNASNYSNATSQRKEVGFAVLNRTSPLLVKPEILKIRRIVGFLIEILGNIKIIPTRTRGIAKMGVNYFYAAWDKSTTLTKNFPPMLYVFDNKRNEDGLSELKILVSVVRFRPGPPRNTKTTFGWFFYLVWLFGLSDIFIKQKFPCRPIGNNFSRLFRKCSKKIS